MIHTQSIDSDFGFYKSVRAYFSLREWQEGVVGRVGARTWADEVRMNSLAPLAQLVGKVHKEH